MRERIEYRPSCRRSRWLGHFDLLGARRLLRSGDHFEVFSVYAKAVEEATRGATRRGIFHQAWFSDTFLIYSDGDSWACFVALEAVVRWFAFFLIMAKIPNRGAMACGDFYADEMEDMYSGEALVESYNYAETQDWIGFVLAPTAVARLDEAGLPARERLHYA
jgi:hypothetical protein